MRPIWKGAISFGMVTIPVKLYSATEERDVRFRLLHRTDHAPIVEKRFCSEENREVAWDDLVRGFEVRKGEYVVVEPKEIEEAKPESASTIEIGDFVELEEIDPIYFEKSYFLEPDEVGARPFSLLKRALEETGRIAVARVVIRSRERLATIRAYDGTLVLETMYFPDEIRSTGGLDLPGASDAKVSSRELQMARALVENLSDRFKPEEYQDRYRIALQELIERKMAGEKRNAKRRQPEPKIVDLMAALEASVAASRSASRTKRRKAAAPRPPAARARKRSAA
ncbi:MAG: Ku protein [Chloroflexota bacterium]|nr:Ku protein [Chloroflexota bacterium]